MFDFKSLDLENVDTSADVPVGNFGAQITEVEFKESSTGNPMLVFSLSIIGDKYKDYKLKEFIVISSDFGKKKLAQIIEAVNGPKVFDSFEQLTQMTLNKVVLVKTKKEVSGEYTNARIMSVKEYDKEVVASEAPSTATTFNASDLPF